MSNLKHAFTTELHWTQSRHHGGFGAVSSSGHRLIWLGGCDVDLQSNASQDHNV